MNTQAKAARNSEPCDRVQSQSRSTNHNQRHIPVSFRTLEPLSDFEKLQGAVKRNQCPNTPDPACVSHKHDEIPRPTPDLGRRRQRRRGLCVPRALRVLRQPRQLHQVLPVQRRRRAGDRLWIA